MKFITAEFKNFRLLRNLKLDFSTNNEKKLTVIRGENECGKTTILNALQWGLYGNEVLPKEGIDYPLLPIDWDPSDKDFIQISVKIEFEKSKSQISQTGGVPETNSRYIIIRSLEENTDGQKQKLNVKLFEVTSSGSKPINDPDAWIKRELLPTELREVFFTDGDRALAFIDGEEKENREKVKNAIKSLLGLDIIENAGTHLKSVASGFNKSVKKMACEDELNKIATELDCLDTDISVLMENRDKIRNDFDKRSDILEKIDKKIELALLKGDREELVRNLKKTESELSQIKEKQSEVDKSNSDMFRNLNLFRDLLFPILGKSFNVLDELRDQGKLPSATIPVLEERLKSDTCICGESLDPNNHKDNHRRLHIQKLIEDSRKDDLLQMALTDLYYESLPLKPKTIDEPEHWVAEYVTIMNQKDILDNSQEELEKKLKAIEVQIEDVGDTDIQGLRIEKKELIEQREKLNESCIQAEIDLKIMDERRKSLIASQNNLTTQHNKVANILAQLDVTRDIEKVLLNTITRLMDDELSDVSEMMNNLFLKMIGADPEQRAIIQKAEISKDFDILVFGTNNNQLNPSQDLNGASRRALTISFVLALSKVSEVRAPNVIDTPLGMMAGYVKQSVLKTAIRESSQLILFLTSSEIAGCEEILDTEAGVVITITNTAHYPTMLKYKPQLEVAASVPCRCNHRGESNSPDECKICTRVTELDEK